MKPGLKRAVEQNRRDANRLRMADALRQVEEIAQELESEGAWDDAGKSPEDFMEAACRGIRAAAAAAKESDWEDSDAG